MADAASATHGEMNTHEKAELSQAKLGMWLFLGSEVMFFTGFIAAYIVLRESNDLSADKAHLNKWLAALNTLILITSSLTMAMAVGAIQRGQVQKMKNFIILTILCACGFMVVKYFEYNAKLNATTTVAMDDFEDMFNKYNDLGRNVILGAPATLIDLDKDEPREFPAGTVIKDFAMVDDLAEAPKEIVLRTPYGPDYSVFFACYYTLTGFHGLHVLAGIICLLYIYFRANYWGTSRYAFVEGTGLYWHFVDIVWIFLFPILYLI